MVSGKEVRFIPMNNNSNVCYAQVFLKQQENKKDLDIGKTLLGLGFAETTPLQEIDFKIDKTTYKNLLSHEERAKKLRLGLWNKKIRENLTWKLSSTVEKIIFKIKPPERKIPALVR